MDITYLGAEGWLIKRGAHAILTGPLLSNPGLLSVLINAHIRPDTQWIDRKLGTPQMRRDLLSVDAILIGHSHYDHLMDVPYIAENFARNATIWGTPSAGHILHGDSLLRPVGHVSEADGRPHRVMVIDSSAVGSHARAGTWIYVGKNTIRFMALASEHVPNVGNYLLAPGLITRDRDDPPRKVYDWRVGETYAYLIDFLRPDSSVVFRLYYMDAVARPPLGFPPPLDGADTARVTVAILCGGNFEQVADYPGRLLGVLHPKQVLLGHWESFFRSQRKSTKVLPFLDEAKLARRLDNALPDSSGWVTPALFSTTHYCSCR